VADRTPLEAGADPVDDEAPAAAEQAADGTAETAAPEPPDGLDEALGPPDPEVATPPAEGASTARGRGLPGLLRSPALAWAVAAVAVAVALATWLANQPLRAEARDRVEAKETAEVVAARLTTFSGAEMEQWVAATQELSTGEYAGQVAELFDTELREALRATEVESVGQVLRSFVQDVEGEEATVFVIVRQTSTNNQRQQPVEDEVRMEVTLRRVDGRFLAANVAVLGPGVVSAAAPPAPGVTTTPGPGEGAGTDQEGAG
jgi:Mce-associated membrane protein